MGVRIAGKRLNTDYFGRVAGGYGKGKEQLQVSDNFFQGFEV